MKTWTSASASTSTAGGEVDSPPRSAKLEKVSVSDVIGVDSEYQTVCVAVLMPNTRQEPADVMMGTGGLENVISPKGDSQSLHSFRLVIVVT